MPFGEKVIGQKVVRTSHDDKEGSFAVVVAECPVDFPELDVAIRLRKFENGRKHRNFFPPTHWPRFLAR